MKSNLKTKFDKKMMKFVIPVAGSLSEPIWCFPKETNILRVIRVNKSFRLLHVENFSNISVQECGLYVKLNDLQIIFSCDGHDQANNFKLNNGRESLGVVNPSFLGATLCNQTGFEFIDIPVG